MSGLTDFAADHTLTAARFTAIGAFCDLTLGWFNLDTKDYEEIPLDEQVEVVSLVGNVAVHHNGPKVHVHAVVGKRDGTACGGHVLNAHVRPTLEVVVIESPFHLRREIDPDTGLALLAPEKETLPPRRGREVAGSLESHG